LAGNRLLTDVLLAAAEEAATMIGSPNVEALVKPFIALVRSYFALSPAI
jgi:hypothetical protein